MTPNSISRERIIHATIEVIGEKGVAGATTRAIVQAVPCAEGTLYIYFKHRTELLLAVIEECASRFVDELIKLPLYVGQKTVEDNLAMIIRQAAKFQESALTLFCGVISDPELLLAQQELMRKARKGPHLSRFAISKYLEAEKALGRVYAELDSEMTAALLLRASFGRVFEERFAGTKSAAASRRHMRSLISALLAPSDALSAVSRDGTKMLPRMARKECV